MKSKFSQKLFLLMTLMFFPAVSLAMIYEPHLEWEMILLFSLIVFLVMFVVWIISPLGIIFILTNVFQFLFPRKAVLIVAWVFQGIVFILSLLLGIVGLVYVYSAFYGEQKYIFVVGLGATMVTVCCLMTGTMVAQIIWQVKKLTRSKSKSLEEEPEREVRK